MEEFRAHFITLRSSLRNSHGRAIQPRWSDGLKTSSGRIVGVHLPESRGVKWKSAHWQFVCERTAALRAAAPYRTQRLNRRTRDAICGALRPGEPRSARKFIFTVQ